VSDKRAVARFGKETGVDESSEDGVTRGFIESPEAARLLGRKAQPGHLQKLSADTMDDLLDSPARLNHRRPQTRE